MEIKPINLTKGKVELEIVGEDRTLCNALRDELWNVKGVDIAAYGIEHPLVNNPTILVETSGDAKKALLKAADNIKDKNKELKDKLKKIL